MRNQIIALAETTLPQHSLNVLLIGCDHTQLLWKNREIALTGSLASPHFSSKRAGSAIFDEVANSVNERVWNPPHLSYNSWQFCLRLQNKKI